MSTRPTTFDPSSVTRATWIAAGSALVLLIATFLTWFSLSVKVGGFSSGTLGSASGWDSGALGKLIALLALLALVVVALELFATNVSLPYPPSLLLVGLGAVSTLLVIIKLLDKPSSGSGYSWGYGIGIFLALIAAIGVTVGGYLKMQES